MAFWPAHVRQSSARQSFLHRHLKVYELLPSTTTAQYITPCLLGRSLTALLPAILLSSTIMRTMLHAASDWYVVICTTAARSSKRGCHGVFLVGAAWCGVSTMQDGDLYLRLDG